MTSTGERYWRRTLHEFGTLPGLRGKYGNEGDPDEPARFTAWRGLPRFPLPTPASRLTDGLSELLHYTYGVSRLELGPLAMWPYHRLVPSARCFFPTELYCWLPETGRLPAGLYAYDAAHHALVLVRAGVAVDALGAAVGADLAGADCVLVFASVFWRTAFRYGDYAYRLCAQEVGMTVGNALLVAGSQGRHGHVHHQFVDADLQRLLGLDWPAESAMSVVALYPGPRPMLAAPARPPVIEPAATGFLDPRTCGPLIEIDAASRRTDLAIRSTLDSPAVEAEPLTVPNLADVLRARRSGGPAFNPVRRPITLHTVEEIVAPALSPHVSDAVAPGACPPVACYVWAITPSDGEPGIYRLQDGRLTPVRRRGTLAGRLRSSNVNYRTANFVAFLVADQEQAQRRLGDRSFRVLNQEAGIVAQRICVLAATRSLAGRVHNGYPAAEISAELGLPTAWQPLFQIVVGTAGPSARYQMPIPFVGGAR
ncbi:SagB family peptide dehydrogenase [Kutzneria buriramensis]|uniref:SagB-type dehydrogenase family enzyme n=1 Tax=Kutzneria buriramensis TaxID=1045776 RepID=A0A3E0H062_9PSEU|nr:SagB family peptide dehydrogenase [Kutzneria buriramensis]REH35712.1 SagB-type dehydrogenase family enzyme [Kutzneria buriramensis]